MRDQAVPYRLRLRRVVGVGELHKDCQLPGGKILIGLRVYYPPIMENHMEKKMENDMETAGI